MNKSKDKIMKEFLENNAYFVDFFNAYFFDGERVLKPENCMELDSEMNDSNMVLITKLIANTVFKLNCTHN